MLLAALASGSVQAAQEPLWEAGVGVAAIDFPDYRGADERHSYVLPLPYLVYRGDILKADRDGARGQFFRNDRLDLHLSLNGSIPVDSSDNSARRDMPDLDPTLEIGPNLVVKMLRDREHDVEVDLRLPVRAVFATDFTYVRDVGWVFQPSVSVDFHDTWLGEGWNTGFSLGPLFGNRRYHNYFYEVAPAFATPQRPAFEAAGGYAGMQVIATVSRHFEKFWFGAFVRADTLSGAAFEDSPLIRQNESYAVGFAVTWALWKSERMVETED